MNVVIKEVCDSIQDNDLTFAYVAKEIGTSKQNISNFKKGGKIGFRNLLRLAFLLYNDPNKKMSEWCLRLNSSESIKQSFEYAAITRNIKLLKDLISKFKNEDGVIGEYVKVYTIIYKYMNNKIKGNLVAQEIEKLHPQDYALQILSVIFKCLHCYFSKQFILVPEYAQQAEKMLTSLNDRELFMKECFLHRIAEILSPIYLYLNNLELARYYANTIIFANICAKTVSDAYYIVGMSYLLEDRDKCLENLKTSYDYMAKVGDEDLAREAKYNLDFAKLFYGLDLDEHSNEVLLAVKNDKLEIIEEELYQGSDDEFIIYFNALSKNSVDELYDCHEHFINEYNLFFASAIAQALIKAGENERAIRHLQKFKITPKGEVHFEKDFISCFSRFSNRSRGNIG